MKKRILTIASMLFLAIMIPLTVNAATISVEPKEMKVGDIVTVTVEVETADTESVQFDLDFDATKYEYIPDSATSELDSTDSNLLDNDTVRVGPFNFNTINKVSKVSLKFTAKNAGTSVPFKVVDGSLEATDGTGITTVETFAEPKAVVSKIEGLPTTDKKDPEYFDENGNPIDKHKPTGDNTTRTITRKSIAGIYTKIISGKLVVPYALPTSDDTLTVEDIENEFANADTTGLTNPIKSGDKFTLNGQEHIVLIYGDVNKDGKVTAADALITRKYESSALTPDEVTSITSEVAEFTDDSKAIQQFVLRKRTTATKTILDTYPVEFTASDIVVTPNKTSIYRGERTLVTTISTNDGRAISSELVSITQPANITLELVDNNNSVEIYTTSNNTNAFDIKPVLQGNNLENGKIEKNSQSITVNEVATVTRIALFDENNNEINEEYSLLSGEIGNLTIKYYHTYSDGTEIELTDDNTSETFFDVDKVKLTQPNPLTLDTILFLDNSLNNASTSLKSIHNIRLISKLGQLGSDNLSIKVINDSTYSSTNNYKPSIEIPLKVTISNELVTGLKINNQLVNNSDEININLYSSTPSNDKTYHINDSDGDSYFTILDIDLITNTNKTKKLTSSICSDYLDEDANNDINSFIISQNSDPEGSGALRVVYFKNQNGIYTPTDDADVEIDAIGISYYSDYDSSIDELKDGLTIHFGGIEKDGIVTKNTINVKVTPVDNRDTSPTKAPQTSPTTSTEPSASVEPTTSPEPSQTPTVDNENDLDLDDFFNVPSDFDENLSTTTTTTPEVTATPETTPDVNPETSPEVTTTPEDTPVEE